MQKKVAKGDKANHGWENVLLCAFEVKVSKINSWLDINFLALTDIRALGC